MAERGIVCVSVDYRLSPEVKYPAALRDVKAAYAWLTNEGTMALDLDPNKIVLGGVSAGANLAAALACRLAFSPSPFPTPKLVVLESALLTYDKRTILPMSHPNVKYFMVNADAVDHVRFVNPCLPFV